MFEIDWEKKEEKVRIIEKNELSKFIGNDMESIEIPMIIDGEVLYCLIDHDRFASFDAILRIELFKYFPEKKDLISNLDMEMHYSVDDNFVFSNVLWIQFPRIDSKYDQPNVYIVEVNEKGDVNIKTKKRYLDLIKKQKRTSRNTLKMRELEEIIPDSVKEENKLPSKIYTQKIPIRIADKLCKTTFQWKPNEEIIETAVRNYGINIKKTLEKFTEINLFVRQDYSGPPKVDENGMSIYSDSFTLSIIRRNYSENTQQYHVIEKFMILIHRAQQVEVSYFDFRHQFKDENLIEFGPKEHMLSDDYYLHDSFNDLPQKT
jgi:hypothetical protein